MFGVPRSLLAAINSITKLWLEGPQWFQIVLIIQMIGCLHYWMQAWTSMSITIKLYPCPHLKRLLALRTMVVSRWPGR
jgi:hypothetical protein